MEPYLIDYFRFMRRGHNKTDGYKQCICAVSVYDTDFRWRYDRCGWKNQLKGEEHEKETYENAEGGYDTRCGTDCSDFFLEVWMWRRFFLQIQFRFRVMEAV